MVQITVKPITSKNTWEKFLVSRPEANFLQSWNWGEFHHRLDKTVIRLGFFQGQTLKGVMLAIVEKAKRATYLTVPGGPLINWEDQDMVAAFVQNLKPLAVSRNCSFVRVRPQILDTPENRRRFHSLGFRPAPMHLHAELTHQLDLALTEDQLLSQMRKTTRYEIRRAQKLGIKVTTSRNPQDIKDFYQLQHQTAVRQNFVEFNRDFLYHQFSTFVTHNQAILYTAKLNHQLLAQAFIIFYGQEADYHYGASTEIGRRYPGSYLVQWQAIKEAKRLNITRYNFWGVAPASQHQHRFYGVSVFKRGFGGQDVAYLHAQDLVINPYWYLINWLIESCRKILRRI